MRLKECGFEVLAALDTARTAAATIATINSTADKPIYADCNAVSPQTKLEMESMIRAAGGRFIDIGIIGRAAPRGAESPEAARAEKRSGKAVVSALAESRMPAIRIQGII
jgi:3-hydroxyisobutyrate dehydrogenase-like beta-hydroxyacid dehydrogenase